MQKIILYVHFHVRSLNQSVVANLGFETPTRGRIFRLRCFECIDRKIGEIVNYWLI